MCDVSDEARDACEACARALPAPGVGGGALLGTGAATRLHGSDARAQSDHYSQTVSSRGGHETGVGASGDGLRYDGPEKSKNGDCEMVGVMSCGASPGECCLPGCPVTCREPARSRGVLAACVACDKRSASRLLDYGRTAGLAVPPRRHRSLRRATGPRPGKNETAITVTVRHDMPKKNADEHQL